LRVDSDWLNIADDAGCTTAGAGGNRLRYRCTHRSYAMTLNQAFFDSWTPRALGALRIVTAFLYVQHGTAKLLHVPHVAMFDQLPLLSLIGFAGTLELVGGLLLLIGLFTRPAAFILCGEMAFAYFMGHAPHGNFLSPSLNNGEPAVLFCFIFLLLSVAGAGAWSVDAHHGRAKGT
jgi:putative oxidoreductase